MDYDITGVFEEIEMALIKSMRNNMAKHIKEEYEEGINWTQWQAEMLSGLSQYRTENKKVLKGYMGKVNAEIDKAIRDAFLTGESEQEIEILEKIKKGYRAPRGKKGSMQGSFFRINQRKLNSLVNATVKDMEKAETALLRMTDDVYRKTLFKAQMFYNTGAGSMWQCVDMATKDFLNAGINCVQYKNGARVNIASYAEMSLRTSNKRANLMGQANTREKWGIHTVKVNARGIACPMCLQWLDKVYIDNVYGGGTEKESMEAGYPLLSIAVEGGLYHPNCKDSCSTYYEGISREPKEITDDDKKEISRRYNLEQKQRYYERNYKRNLRLANGSLDPENQKKYHARALQYKKNLIDLCENNSDVLRYDKARISLRGVLSVDNVGRVAIVPKANKNANTGKIQTMKRSPNETSIKLDEFGVEYLQVEKLEKTRTFDEIVKVLGGADRTQGSCASVGLAYIGQKQGYNVIDFRDGKSRIWFSSKSNKVEMFKALGVESIEEKSMKTNLSNGKKILGKLEPGKEYYLSVGRHASIVRRTEEGKTQYLELQSGYSNGWKDFAEDVTDTLRYRFGCSKSSKSFSNAYLTEIGQLDGNDDFIDILGYINTESDKQMKGDGGGVK